MDDEPLLAALVLVAEQIERTIAAAELHHADAFDLRTALNVIDFELRHRRASERSDHKGAFLRRVRDEALDRGLRLPLAMRYMIGLRAEHAGCGSVFDRHRNGEDAAGEFFVAGAGGKHAVLVEGHVGDVGNLARRAAGQCDAHPGQRFEIQRGDFALGIDAHNEHSIVRTTLHGEVHAAAGLIHREILDGDVLLLRTEAVGNRPADIGHGFLEHGLRRSGVTGLNGENAGGAWFGDEQQPLGAEADRAERGQLQTAFLRRFDERGGRTEGGGKHEGEAECFHGSWVEVRGMVREPKDECHAQYEIEVHTEFIV